MTLPPFTVFKALLILCCLFLPQSGTLHQPLLEKPAAQNKTAANADSLAYFKVGFSPDPDIFIIQLTDPLKIQQARDILQSGLHRGVMGTVIKTPAGYNPSWQYHLEPDSIIFFEVAVEVCDANPRYVAEHLAEACGAFLPGCTWCPWSSRLVEEVWFETIYLPLIQ